MNLLKIKHSILVVSLLVFFSVGSAAAVAGDFVSTLENGYEIFLNPEKPEAGQALVVAFRPVSGNDTQPEQFSGMTFRQRTFQLEPVDGGWRGVAAVPLGTKSGTYELVLRSQTGTQLVLPVAVADHDYGEQRLTVKKEMATPLRPENLKKIKHDRHDLKIAYDSSKAQTLLSDKMVPPLTAKLTSPFGTRRFLNDKPKSPHGGIDYRAKIGVPIRAAATGRVALAEELYYSGKIVIVDHGLSVFTLYMHLSEIDCQPGDSIAAGQIIGKSGKSGRVTGPHLHFGVKIAGVFVDPLRFVEDSRHLLEIPWEVGNGQGKF
jgi:murein DD-endopeptidase MepM/ murein hydrolase activator NlpD